MENQAAQRLTATLDKETKAATLPAPLSKAKEKRDAAEIRDDYELSRDTYKELINTGMSSLDTLAELAREAEHPRAYEVLSRSIKDIGDVTDKLMDLQKSKIEIEKLKVDSSEGKSTTNNNLFVGSTTELQRLLGDIGSDSKIIDVDH